MFDVAIVGGGPAGATCAAFCAKAGLRTLLLEREVFPREKVCGDCLNPASWPILRRLQLEERRPELAARRARSRRVHWPRRPNPGGDLAGWRRSGNRRQAQPLRSTHHDASRRAGGDDLRREHRDSVDCPGRGNAELDAYRAGCDLRSTSACRGGWPELDDCPALQPASARREGAHCAANSSAVAATTSEIASFSNSARKDIPARPRSEPAN